MSSSDDILHRLRENAAYFSWQPEKWRVYEDSFNEAADEIERLRAMVDDTIDYSDLTPEDIGMVPVHETVEDVEGVWLHWLTDGPGLCEVFKGNDHDASEVQLWRFPDERPA